MANEQNDVSKTSSLTKTKERTYQWTSNHQVIRDKMFEYIKANNKMPTKTWLSKETGMTKNTITNHINEINLAPQEHPLKIFTNDVLIATMKSAMNGSVRAQELWFSIMHGWNRGNDENHNVINNIQIQVGLTPENPNK